MTVEDVRRNAWVPYFHALIAQLCGHSRAIFPIPGEDGRCAGDWGSSVSMEAHEWHRIIRASVRECLEACQLQAKAGPVTVEALEAILARRCRFFVRWRTSNPS